MAGILNKRERALARCYNPRMRAHFGFPCWTIFLTLSCAAQPTPSVGFADLLRKASAFAQQADYSHAIPLLQEATQLEPQNPAANFLLGEALLQSGRPSDALTPLQIAANAIPRNESAEGYLGDAAMEVGRFALAAETFRDATTRSPGSEQALLWWTDFSLERYRWLTFSLRASSEGRAALLKTAAESGKSDAKSMESLLQQAAELNPEILGIWGELGVAQSELGQEADAESSLAKAQQQRPGASSTWQLEAMVRAAHGDWQSASKRLLALSERSPAELQRTLASWPPKLIPGAEVKGAVWQCLRQRVADCSLPGAATAQPAKPSAKRLFDEESWGQLAALAAPPEDDGEEWFWRGLAFARLGDCTRAIPALERGLKAGAETAASWLTSCYKLSAVHAADQLKLQGKEGTVHEIRGDILLSIRLDAEQAIVEYKEALTLDPKNPELLKKTAQAYFSLGNMESARHSAEEALALTPHRTELLKLLAQVAMSERDYPSALSRLGQLAQLQPEDAWVPMQQGTAYAQSGHPDQAVELLSSALKAGYTDERGALHFLLAGQLRKLGRDQEAKDASDEAGRLAAAFQHQQQTPGKPGTLQ